MLIADILLCSASMAAAIWCLILNKRLRRFNGLEDGIGAAIAVLSLQVDEMTTALKQAVEMTSEAEKRLELQNERADHLQDRLNLLSTAFSKLSEPRGEDIAPRRGESAFTRAAPDSREVSDRNYRFSRRRAERETARAFV